MNSKSGEIRFQQVAAIAIAVAGILHLAIAPSHWQYAPAHGLFFGIVGAAEIAWAAAFIRRPILKLGTIGLALAVGLIVLWGISRVLPAPFGYKPEGVDIAGLVCKLAEAVGALALATLVFRSYVTNSSRPAAWRALLGVAVVSIALGAMSYGVARASEPLLPTLAASPELTSDAVALGQDESLDIFGDKKIVAQPVSASTLEERTGLQVTLVGVTALGGLIDFRFRVLDEAKVDDIIHSQDKQPKLIAEDSGIVLTATQEMHHKFEMKKGNVYFLFFTNKQNAIRPGTPVSVEIGDVRLEHVIAQ